MIPTREEAMTLLEEYNSDPFHIKHALIVEGVMKYFARKLGFLEKSIIRGLLFYGRTVETA